MVAAMCAGERGLLVASHGADDRGAEMLGPGAQDQPDAAGGRMHQDRVARLHLGGAMQQIFRRHALQHHRGGGPVVDPVGNRD